VSLVPNSFWTALRCDISVLHGPQRDEKKLRITTLPRKSLSEKVFPSISVKVKSGAEPPWTIGEHRSRIATMRKYGLNVLKTFNLSTPYVCQIFCL